MHYYVRFSQIGSQLYTSYTKMVVLIRVFVVIHFLFAYVKLINVTSKSVTYLIYFVICIVHSLKPRLANHNFCLESCRRFASNELCDLFVHVHRMDALLVKEELVFILDLM